MASTATATQPKSYQVVIRIPNAPHYVTAAANFISEDEALRWGHIAASVMAYLVSVDSWRAVPNQEPATRSYQAGKVVRLGSLYQQ